jgi:hypothetical protein
VTAHTPLEQALIAWSKQKNPDDRQPQIDDAVSLGETGVFSNRNIAHITGLDVDFVGELTGKKDKTGGRFNPEALPMIYDIRLQWARARTCDPAAVRLVVNMGVSAGMLSKLTGISRTWIYEKAKP